MTTPEDAQTVFNSKKCLDKPYFLKFTNLPEGSLFGNLEAWRSHRKILNPFFGTSALRVNNIPLFNKKAKILLKIVEKMEGKGEFNVFSNMIALTLETILKVMEYDVDIQNLQSEKRDVYYKMSEK